MNRKVYSFLRRYFLDKDSSTFFTEVLSEEDIKCFIFKTYGISISKVERIGVKPNNVVFKFGGTYLHSGFNNISFEATFIANDFMYKIESPVNIFSLNYLDVWKEFLLQKFGKRYNRKRSKHFKT